MNNKLFTTSAISLLVIVLIASCGGPNAIIPDEGSSSMMLIKSNKPKLDASNVSTDDIDALVSGNDEFAFNLYNRLSGGDGNLFLSPYSISLALAMTYAGARNQTEQQMADVLGFSLPQDQLHAAFNALQQELDSRSQQTEIKEDQRFRLNIVNAIWGQDGYQFLPDYLDTLAQNYGAGLRVLDFTNSPEPSRITINDWVSEQTEERIKDLIPAGAIDTLTRLVLTNAIYFNASWQTPFEESATRDGAFILLDGSQETAQMMNEQENFLYTQGDGYQAIALPYVGGDLDMLIILPDEGQFEQFQQQLDAEQFASIVESLNSKEVALSMPKFKFDAEFSLGDTLKAMGMPLAFSDQADFSGMSEAEDLYISDVVHKAFVSVDESGTEAAAATAVIMKALAMPLEPVKMTVDHPFIFAIRDIPTGSILFLGRVTNPVN
jgi:serpin B